MIKKKDFGYTTLFLSSAILLLTLFVCGFSNPAKIILSFPSPGPGPRDLAWDGKYLWVVDDSTDTVYKINPVEGRLLRSFLCIGSEPRGLTWDGKHLWYSDESIRKTIKIDTTEGNPIFEIDTPIMSIGKGYSPIEGLAWDGNYLWSGWIAGWSSGMTKLNPRNGNTLNFYYTKGFPLGLESDGKFLWSITDNGGIRSGIIYQYDISNGKYVTHFDLPCLYPVGLAYDGTFFWCIDKETKMILKIQVK